MLLDNVYLYILEHNMVVIVYMVKLESVPEITIFGQKMMVKNGLDFFFQITPFQKPILDQ